MKSVVPHLYSHICSDSTVCCWPEKANPGDVKHLPSPNGRDCPVPGTFACTEHDAIVVDVVTGRRRGGRSPNFRIRKPRPRLFGNKLSNEFFRIWLQAEQRRLPFSRHFFVSQDSHSFFHNHNLINSNVLDRVHLSTGPSHFQHIYVCRPT